MEELAGGDLDSFRLLSFEERFTAVGHNFLKGIRNRPLTMEIMAWEMVEPNDLTRGLEMIREIRMRRFFELFFPADGARYDLDAILAILGALISFATTAAAFDMESVRIHGFLSQGYLKSDTNDALFAETSSNGTFEFNEFGLNVVSQVNDDLRVGVQLLSRDMGEIGNNEVEIDWAYGDYNYRNWLGLRAGKMKTPYGLYNYSRDIDAARTCILLPSSIYSEGFRESISTTIGIGAYGEPPGGVEYQVVYGTTQLKEDEGIAKTMGGLIGIPEFSDTSVDWAYAGDFKWFTPIDGI